MIKTKNKHPELEALANIYDVEYDDDLMSIGGQNRGDRMINILSCGDEFIIQCISSDNKVIDTQMLSDFMQAQPIIDQWLLDLK